MHRIITLTAVPFDFKMSAGMFHQVRLAKVAFGTPQVGTYCGACSSMFKFMNLQFRQEIESLSTSAVESGG